MAFSVKYSKKFQRIGVTTTYRVDILSEAGGAIVVPDKMGADPLQHKSLGADKKSDRIVIGSEISFEFVLLKRANEVLYEPLFSSEYREHIVEFYNHDTSTLIWKGYLQPENMSKSLFDSNLHIYLSATDGLKDLQEFDFTDNDAIVTGYLTGLEIIKLCLVKLDQDSQFQYNFIIKLGTKHTGQGLEDNALKDITHDTRRFVRVRDGSTEIDNCLTVIEKILSIYSCVLQQWGGAYYILSEHEESTYYYNYNWALTFLTKIASNDNIAIDGYKFKREADKSYLSPIKEMRLKLLNRNLGENLVVDLNDYDSGVWDYSNYGSGPWSYDDSGSVMILTAENHSPAFRYINGYITLTSNVNIQKLTEGDYIKIQFKIRHTGAATGYGPEYKVISIRDADGAADEGEDAILTINTSFTQYESNLSSYFKLVGSIGETYAYNFKVQILSNSDTTDFDCELYDFSFSRYVVVDEDTYADVTFDSLHKSWLTQGKQIEKTKDIYFGDSPTTGDFAGLVYSGSQTSEWNREGESDDAEILYLKMKNFLISRQEYTEYIICDIKDNTDAISPINYITWGSKKYHIVSYNKSFRSSWLTIHLKEWMTDDITVSYEKAMLTSVDGESSSGTSPYIPPSSATDHNTLINKQGGIANQYYHLTSDEYTGTGTGKFVRMDSPVFTTKITTPALKVTTNAGAGKILISDASGDLTYLAAGTTAQILVGGGAANPVWTTATGTGAPVRANSPVFVTQVTLPATTLVPDGGTIGQAAGPLMTFDDSNNYLEITGCKVGFGIAVPTVPVHIYSSENTILKIESSDAICRLMFSDSVDDAFLTMDSGAIYLGFSTTSANNPFQITATGDIQEPAFTTGWFGGYWQISNSGNAEFENLIIRGSARFRELIIDQLAVLSGSQLLSVARGKILSIDTVNSKVTLDDPYDTGACAFVANDFFWIKNVDIDNGLFSDCRGQITDVTDTTLTLSFAVAGANGAITDIAEGDVIVQRGHPTTASRQNMIYTTVSDTDAPFRRVLTGIDSLAAFNDLDNVVSQEGNLDSLDSHDIVPASPGYGYYSDNVYLSGTIIANAGYIGGTGGWAITSGSLISGSGATRIELDTTNGIHMGATAFIDAPFSVTAAGVLKAISGTIGGWTIDSDSIYTGSEHTTDGYSASGITLHNDGSIHAPKFYLNSDGEAFIAAMQLTHLINKAASATIRNNSFTVETYNNGAWKVMFKYIFTHGLLGSWRVTFDAKKVEVSPGDAYARIYKNGVAYGTQRTLTTSYVTYSEDFTDSLDPNETIELWIYSATGVTTYAKDFCIRYDNSFLTVVTAGYERTGSP